MRVFGVREPEVGDPPSRFLAARTVAFSTSAVVAMAIVQYRLVLHISPQPLALVIPALVGATFGVLVASVRSARAREREMARRLATAQEERFEAMARLAGGVGHDLTNVFTATLSCAAWVRELAAPMREGGCRDCVAALDDLDVSIDRARNISRQLVMLSRPSGAAPERLDLGVVVRGLDGMLRRVLGGTVRLDVHAPAAAPVRADRTELEQLVLNLAVNARDAMPGGGAVAVEVRRDDAGVVLAVRDSGVGMDAETRARMFEPFFTTKPAGKGTGLGLMVVAQVVKRARARIAVRSAPGEGTEVTVTFPIADGGAAAPAS